jgi:hypothetical protein
MLCVADDAADPAEVRDERLPKALDTADVAVGELAVGCAAEGGAVRLQPLAARERALVGQVGPKVVGPVGVGSERAGRRGDSDAGGDDRRRVPAEPQIAFGAELGVCGDDEAARYLELGREGPRRG